MSFNYSTYFSIEEFKEVNTRVIQSLPSDKEYAGIIRDGVFIRYDETKLRQGKDSIVIDTDFIRPKDILVHTHNKDTMPSIFTDADIMAAKSLDVSILLYHSVFHVWDFYDPFFSYPYPFKLHRAKNVKEIDWQDFLNIPYSPVRSDCYSFVRDISFTFFNRELPDLHKQGSIKSIYRHFRRPDKLGFTRRRINKVNGLKPGDLLLMMMSPEIPYHIGIVGNDMHVYHQLSGLSTRMHIEEAFAIAIDTFAYPEIVTS
jgi:hypothetical protein